jgi:hypothetical protein
LQGPQLWGLVHAPQCHVWQDNGRTSHVATLQLEVLIQWKAAEPASAFVINTPANLMVLVGAWVWNTADGPGCLGRTHTGGGGTGAGKVQVFTISLQDRHLRKLDDGVPLAVLPSLQNCVWGP